MACGNVYGLCNGHTSLRGEPRPSASADVPGSFAYRN
jgi:hypothetical protein